MQPIHEPKSKLRSLLVRSLPGGAAVLLSVLLSGGTAAYSASDDKAEKTVHEELRILARVFESVLEGQNLLNGDNRFGTSVFERRIDTQYIPTVGAIVTIPVDFPIVNPNGNNPIEAIEPEDESDLWERIEKDLDESGSSKPMLLEDIKVRISEMQDKNVRAQDVRKRLETEHRARLNNVREQIEVHIEPPHVPPVPNPRPSPYQVEVMKRERHGVQWSSRAPAKSFAWDVSFHADSPYDAQKVERLTQSIIEHTAIYGHRLEQLPKSERLLVVIEAPGTDRTVFAFQKSDLMQEKTYDELKNKADRTDY